jgi:hypothetical protein
MQRVRQQEAEGSTRTGLTGFRSARVGQGVGHAEQRYGEFRIILYLSEEGTGKVTVFFSNFTPYGSDATYHGGLVQFEYQGLSFTSQFTGGNALTLSGKSSGGQTQTWELTRMQ